MRLILAVFLAFLSACSSSDPRVLTDEGSRALNSGKYADAAKSYEKALAQLGTDTANPDWLRAKLGLVRAHIHMDAGQAQKEFLDLAAAAPSKVTDEEFNRIAAELGEARHTAEAIAVLDAGMSKFPEAVNLKVLRDDLGKRAEASGDSGALEALKGLGYGGGK